MTDDSLIDALQNDRAARGFGGRIFGVVPGRVVDLRDPDGQGRVKLELPWSPDGSSATFQVWARLATLAAGNERGSWFVPENGDEVLVAFEHGDPRRPYVIGALWNGRDRAPEQMDDAGNNDKKVIKTRSGLKITFDDAQGGSSLTIETPRGRVLRLDDGGNEIELDDGAGNSISFDSSGITIEASAKVTIRGSSVEITSGSVTVNAGTTTCSGTVTAPTVIASSVVGTVYTPGTGNIL